MQRSLLQGGLAVSSARHSAQPTLSPALVTSKPIISLHQTSSCRLHTSIFHSGKWQKGRWQPCASTRQQRWTSSANAAGTLDVQQTVQVPSSADCSTDSMALPSSSVQKMPSNGPAGTPSCMCTLMVQCPDQKGVIAALAQLLYGLGCNIIESDQFTDTATGLYFQRIRCDFSEIVVGVANTAVLESAVGELAGRFNMDWKVFYDAQPKRVAVLVSKMDHCLYDLLIRHQRGELRCELPIVISNHPNMESVARSFGVEFRHFPVLGKGPDAKRDQEAQIEAAIQELNIDLLVLARYMQIFSPAFCSRHAMHTINIHHSFLPAFEGAKPYHRAYERGVKLLGATSHYATSELDAGPIIDQDVVRITHRDGVQDMIRKGRDLERMVLARAVRWVLEDRVLVHGNKTVVFGD